MSRVLALAPRERSEESSVIVGRPERLSSLRVRRPVGLERLVPLEPVAVVVAVAVTAAAPVAAPVVAPRRDAAPLGRAPLAPEAEAVAQEPLVRASSVLETTHDLHFNGSQRVVRTLKNKRTLTFD